MSCVYMESKPLPELDVQTAVQGAHLQQPLLGGLRDTPELTTEAPSTLVYPGFTRALILPRTTQTILPNCLNKCFISSVSETQKVLNDPLL